MERAEDGTEVPPSWFGLSPDEGEDPVEQIASSDEGTEESKDEEGANNAPDGGATSRTQPDTASANEPWETTSAVTDAVQAARCTFDECWHFIFLNSFSCT